MQENNAGKIETKFVQIEYFCFNRLTNKLFKQPPGNLQRAFPVK